MRAVLAPRRSSLALVLALLPGALACGPTNREACLDYVDKVNAAYTACGVVDQVDGDETCPAYLDQGGADCREYYECLGEEIECRNGEIVHHGLASDPAAADNRRCVGCV